MHQHYKVECTNPPRLCGVNKVADTYFNYRNQKQAHAVCRYPCGTAAKIWRPDIEISINTKKAIILALPEKQPLLHHIPSHSPTPPQCHPGSSSAPLAVSVYAPLCSYSHDLFSQYSPSFPPPLPPRARMKNPDTSDCNTASRGLRCQDYGIR
jgi:hypothetical protein